MSYYRLTADDPQEELDKFLAEVGCDTVFVFTSLYKYDADYKSDDISVTIQFGYRSELNASMTAQELVNEIGSGS